MHTLRNIIATATGLVVLLTCPRFSSEAPGEEQAGTDRQLSVRRRLQRAIDVTRELEGKARHPKREELGMIRPQPVLEEDRRMSGELWCSCNGEVARYAEQRPWSAHFSWWGSRWHVANASKWPCPADALRAVNAHAGEEIFPKPFLKELSDRTLPEVLEKVADALR